VIFDENVFLFTKLKPNVGPRLREEILLLPPPLINHSHGGEIVNDHMTSVSSATDACENPQSAQENLGQDEASVVENLVQNEVEAANITRAEAGTEPGGDLSMASALGSVPRSAAEPAPGSMQSPVATPRSGVTKRMEQMQPQDLLWHLHPEIKLYNSLLPLQMLLHQQIFDHGHVCRMVFIRPRYTLVVLSVMVALLLLLESHMILVKPCLIYIGKMLWMVNTMHS
jgi:hypothetical protein